MPGVQAVTIDDLRAPLRRAKRGEDILLTKRQVAAILAALDVAVAAIRYISDEEDGSVLEVPTRRFLAALTGAKT
jgi:hypothetical protein